MKIVPHTVLSIGMSGGDVPVLHQILIEQGFSCGEDPNSSPQVFGHSTDSAVKLFQASHDGPDTKCLSVDGVVGPNTWWALENPSGSAQGEPGQVLLDMPSQEPSNPIAAASLQSAWLELHKQVFEIPDGSNRNPEIDLYTGMSGKPLAIPGPAWCAYFVSWNFAKAPSPPSSLALFSSSTRQITLPGASGLVSRKPG
jgi:Putative peptidoglycan binding domain.